MTRRPKIAVLSFSRINRDARVLRQIQWLSERYEVEVVGYGELDASIRSRAVMHSLPLPEEFIRRNLKAVPKLALGKVMPDIGYERWYWDRPDYVAGYEATRHIKPRAVLANDWDALPAGARAAKDCGARLLLDLHEYSPEQWENRRAWMLLISPMISYFLHKHGGDVSLFTTVGKLIADRYREQFGFDARVIMNAPELTVPPTFRATDPERINLIHHGAATSDRKLEVMIEAIALSQPRYSLHFMLPDSNRGYVKRLQKISLRLAPGRVFFHPAVPLSRIVHTIERYDMGIYILRPYGFNSQASLPNKFFDFICAGLATCTGPSPEMASLAQEYGFGVVSDSFDPVDVAEPLNKTTADEIDAMKHRAIAACQVLNARVEMNKFLKLLHDLFDDR